ncbi:Os04g0190000, partial [Oryza sativa Japonica Group]
NDSDIAEMVAMWGGLHEFGDVASLPRRRMVVYREHGRAADHAGFLDAVDPFLNLFFFY